MTIFVINIGSVYYANYSLPLIEKLCEYNNIQLFILDQDISQNIHQLHPSWLKLFCHSLIDDEFILCWDLDLVPTKLFDIKTIIDTTRVNMCYDGTYIANSNRFNHKFKYNAGLLGIPKTYKTFFESIYDTCYGSNYPSFEQYHVNDKLYDNNVNVNILDSTYNYMLCDQNIDELQTKNCIHYTWKIYDNNHRNTLIQQHYHYFKSNFNL